MHRFKSLLKICKYTKNFFEKNPQKPRCDNMGKSDDRQTMDPVIQSEFRWTPPGFGQAFDL